MQDKDELQAINKELLGVELKLTSLIEETKRTLNWVGCLRNKLFIIINKEELKATGEGD